MGALGRPVGALRELDGVVREARRRRWLRERSAQHGVRAMTYSSGELEEMGVCEFAREWRKWRRSMYLTIPEAAAMAGVSSGYLQRVEVGQYRVGSALHARLVQLMERWDESKRPLRSVQRRARRAYYAARDKRRDARDRRRAA